MEIWSNNRKKENRPVALVIKKNYFSSSKKTKKTSFNYELSREEVIKTLLKYTNKMKSVLRLKLN